MAVLKADIDFNFEPLRILGEQFPEFRGRLLAVIGGAARNILKADYLSGQDITLRAFPTDKNGRYTITSDVNRQRTFVKVYSYPMNLFERGRTLRDDTKEPGKYTITRKLKMDVMSNIPRYITYFENQILKPEIKKVGL